jgi:CheY-like chemotaxis protein/HPt (histidine-containing phosphotransfer) domain-containing protein
MMVFDQAVAAQSLAELRKMAESRPDLQLRFVVLERGARRRSRVEDSDLVKLDAEVMHRNELVKAVCIAAGRISPEIETQTMAPVFKRVAIPLTREVARQQGSLILVAEDNEINQSVILHQMHLLGRTADIADNGRIALEMWQSGDYSILLTDLNMPEMDGYELAAAIRTAEAGKSHKPIIALTANALKGEAEHCLEVGMDDYLSKPVQLANLKARLDKYLPAVEETPISVEIAQTAAVAEQASTKPVDVSVLKALVGDDEESIREFLHDFRLSATKIAGELRKANGAGQTGVVGGLAHKLKSSSRSVGALELGEICSAMEQAGKTGNKAELEILMQRFEQELAVVERYLKEY